MIIIMFTSTYPSPKFNAIIMISYSLILLAMRAIVGTSIAKRSAAPSTIIDIIAVMALTIHPADGPVCGLVAGGVVGPGCVACILQRPCDSIRSCILCSCCAALIYIAPVNTIDTDIQITVCVGLLCVTEPWNLYLSLCDIPCKRNIISRLIGPCITIL